jgi:hypothetical protein
MLTGLTLAAEPAKAVYVLMRAGTAVCGAGTQKQGCPKQAKTKHSPPYILHKRLPKSGFSFIIAEKKDRFQYRSQGKTDETYIQQRRRANALRRFGYYSLSGILPISAPPIFL